MQEAEQKMRSLRATIQHLRTKNPESSITVRFFQEEDEGVTYPAEQIPTLGVILEELEDPDELEFSVSIDNKLMRRGTIIIREEEQEPQKQVVESNKAKNDIVKSMTHIMQTSIQQVIQATDKKVEILEEMNIHQLKAQAVFNEMQMKSMAELMNQKMELALERQRVEMGKDETNWVELIERLTEIVPQLITDGVDVYSKIKAAREGEPAA